MKQITEFINKLTDYIDLGIFYLGYILFFLGTYSFISTVSRIGSGYNELGHYPNFVSPGVVGSVIGVYFIRSYKKKDK